MWTSLNNNEILSNSPFGKTTQTVVAFQWQHKGLLARFKILKKLGGNRPTMHTWPTRPLINACAYTGFLCDSQGNEKIQHNRRKDQRGGMGCGGEAPRVPSSRGKSLESWCVGNAIPLRARQSYKAGKLLIAGGSWVDERPVDRA